MMSERRITVGNIEIKYHEDGSISFRQDDDFIKVRRDLLERFREALFEEDGLATSTLPLMSSQNNQQLSVFICPTCSGWSVNSKCPVCKS